MDTASWTRRRAEGIVPVWKLAGLRLIKGRLKKKNQKSIFQLESSQPEGILFYCTILFYSGLQLTRWGPSTLRRSICFTQSTDSFKIIFDQISEHPMALSSWHRKLFITQNMECYMIIKRNKVDLYILTWKYLQASLLNEKSHWIIIQCYSYVHMFILYVDICTYLNTSKKSWNLLLWTF